MTVEVNTEGVISGSGALAEFRQGLTGQYAADLLRQAGERLIIVLPVGVGKSQFMVKTIVHMVQDGSPYDLVLVLVPRTDILKEVVRKLPRMLPRVVLEPRPQAMCGDLNEQWIEYEANGCATLARQELCRSCRHRTICSWLGQQTPDRLQGARLIFATQQHIVIDSGFVKRISALAGAERTLVLVDESDLIVRSTRSVIGRADLDRFIAAQEATAASTEESLEGHGRWLNLSRQLASTDTDALTRWERPFPKVTRKWATGVQRAGRALYGPSFRFLGHELIGLARSEAQSRERTTAGDFEFGSSPQLGDSFIVYSGSVARGLAQYRLDPGDSGPPLSSPFQGLRFEHPQTLFFNIKSFQGAHSNFPGNAGTILDFFAQKVADNIRLNRRTLLIAKKDLVPRCASYLTQRLDALGVGPVSIVTAEWGKAKLRDPRVLPLVTYGISGVNLFEGYECAYCLCGYYISAQTVTQAVQDLQASAYQVPLEIEVQSNPRRRCVLVTVPEARETRLQQVADWTLEQLESDVVLQAVGRVRPFTSPREVICFQNGTLPGVRFSLEFDTLKDARDYFGIKPRRLSDLKQLTMEVWQQKQLRLSHAQIAKNLGVHKSTVKRHLKLYATNH